MNYGDIEMSDVLGGFNDFPKNWRAITPAEYALAVYRNNIISTQYRYMVNKGVNDRSGIEGTLIIFSNDTGVATSIQLEYVDGEEAYIPKFWAFGCNHLYKTEPWDTTLGNQYYQKLRVCKHCGNRIVVDSSD